MADTLPSDTSAEAGPSDSSTFARWRDTFSRMTGSTSPELSPEQQEERLRIQDEKDYNKCEKWKLDLMRKSPMIIFMLKQLDLAGCTFTPSNIQCYSCPDTTSGGFSADLGILLCQNQFVFGKKHVETTLTHEMIHAFDHCRFKMDPKANLRHHACTEIRAANLSGECNWAREFFYRGHYWKRWSTLGKHHQDCVKRRAATALGTNPSITSPEQAQRAVDEVFESCFKDTRPFDEIY